MSESINNHISMYPLYINLTIMSIISIPDQENKFHPMILMFMLISTTLLMSLKMNFMEYSWITYFLFLILIGGLMIIFMYISSLSNNELFFMSYKNMMLNMWKITPIQNLFWFLYLMNEDQMNMQDLWNLQYDYMLNQFNINIIYMKLNNKTLYFIMIYLYYTMICVMNICYKNNMPLRQLSN